MSTMDFSNIATPEEYSEAAFLARVVAEEMLTRLQVVKLSAQWILDLGCGVGADLPGLTQRFPEAEIIGMDCSELYLDYGKRQAHHQGHWIAADAGSLPLASHSVDLIFANLLLPWSSDPLALLKEWRRVLRPGGLLFFSCLGPDTFKQTQTEFLPGLVDMHEVGDALLEQGYVDPVLEVEDLTLTYPTLKRLQSELEKSGMLKKGLKVNDITTVDGVFPISYEVIYGHAWCPVVKAFKSDKEGVVKVPISHLKAKK